MLNLLKTKIWGADATSSDKSKKKSADKPAANNDQHAETVFQLYKNKQRSSSATASGNKSAAHTSRTARTPTADKNSATQPNPASSANTAAAITPSVSISASSSGEPSYSNSQSNANSKSAEPESRRPSNSAASSAEVQLNEMQQKLAALEKEQDAIKAEREKLKAEKQKEDIARKEEAERQKAELEKERKAWEEQRKKLNEELARTKAESEAAKADKEEAARKQKEQEAELEKEKARIKKEADEAIEKEKAAYEAKRKADTEEQYKIMRDMAEKEVQKIKQEKKLEEEQRAKKQASGTAAGSSFSAAEMVAQKEKNDHRELLIQALEQIIRSKNIAILEKPKYTGDIVSYAKTASFTDLQELLKTFERGRDPVLCPLLKSIDAVEDPYNINLENQRKQAKLQPVDMQSVELTVQIHEYDPKAQLEKRMVYVLNNYQQSSASNENGLASQQRLAKKREFAIGMSNDGKPIVSHFTADEFGYDITSVHKGNGDEYNRAVKDQRGVFLTAKKPGIVYYYTVEKRNNINQSASHK